MSNGTGNTADKKPLSKGMLYFFVAMGLFSLGKLGYGIYQDRIESAKEQAANERDFSQLINEVESNMDSYLANLNKQLPIEVDDVTQLVKLERTNKVVNAYYQITDANAANILSKDTTKASEVIKDSVLKAYCTETWTKSLLNLNYQIKSIYRSEGHPELLDFIVLKADCARFRGLN
ncbi:hypothetical protein [Budvicia aquatica]|uniref:Uncharacterized protein n=1 Tax=Budvicia aquatica TaxID=82979 RepID=A0A2C6DS96_9GAMM|nr:hypothetical protein [Budvicia aquatica]PHI31694.1 hypothetical protein CRN84_21355 [Budvicia aquatica]VFS52483.1 Uncharacterised protein [Budvicia aquatica]